MVWFTLWQAAVSTTLTLAVGLPIAYALARFAFRGRALLEAAVLVPFVLPTVVVGMAFGGGGASLTAMFAAHVFLNVAVVVRIVGGAWAPDAVAARRGRRRLRLVLRRASSQRWVTPPGMRLVRLGALAGYRWIR